VFGCLINASLTVQIYTILAFAFYFILIWFPLFSCVTSAKPIASINGGLDILKILASYTLLVHVYVCLLFEFINKN
tara:strand:- start:4931 stop:5158 length:228 start_codon:yes stop_codon:yes gene_type:complete